MVPPEEQEEQAGEALSKHALIKIAQRCMHADREPKEGWHRGSVAQRKDATGGRDVNKGGREVDVDLPPRSSQEQCGAGRGGRSRHKEGGLRFTTSLALTDTRSALAWSERWSCTRGASRLASPDKLHRSSIGSHSPTDLPQPPALHQNTARPAGSLGARLTAALQLDPVPRALTSTVRQGGQGRQVRRLHSTSASARAHQHEGICRVAETPRRTAQSKQMDRSTCSAPTEEGSNLFKYQTPRATFARTLAAASCTASPPATVLPAPLCSERGAQELACWSCWQAVTSSACQVAPARELPLWLATTCGDTRRAGWRSARTSARLAEAVRLHLDAAGEQGKAEEAEGAAMAALFKDEAHGLGLE